MILTKLVDLYDKFAVDPDPAVLENLPRYGFSLAKVVHEFTLNEAGQIVGYMSLRETVEQVVGYDKKKDLPKIKKVELPALMIVPEQKGRTQNIAPHFLCDTLTYIIGINSLKKEETQEKKLAKFTASKELHLARLAEIGDPLLEPVKRFYETWDPMNFTQVLADSPEVWADWERWEDGLTVFRLPNAQQRAHELESVKQYAVNRVSNQEGQYGMCLVTGQANVLVAEQHPNIKMPGGGSKFVSYNSKAFESYNLKGGSNAPVGVEAAFKYTEALNALIGIKNQRISLGGTTMVYWSDGTSDYEREYSELFNLEEGNPELKKIAVGEKKTVRELKQRLFSFQTTDQGTVTKAHVPMKAGQILPEKNIQPFYILGLEPNMQRLGVRFFWQSTIEESLDIMARHYNELELVRFSEKQPELIPLRTLVNATKSSVEKELSPIIVGYLLQAVVTGQRHHQSLLSHVIGRIRRDHEAGYVRTALIKAILWRNHAAYLLSHASLRGSEQESEEQNKQRRLVVLNEELTNVGYLSGRLFALLEKAQDIAINANASISDRYLGAAATRPATVFPLLLRLNVHHNSKIGGGLAVNIRAEIERIVAGFFIIDGQTAFPRVLSLEDQGLFFVGYYHQRSAMSERLRSEKKDDDTSSNSEND